MPLGGGRRTTEDRGGFGALGGETCRDGTRADGQTEDVSSPEGSVLSAHGDEAGPSRGAQDEGGSRRRQRKTKVFKFCRDDPVGKEMHARRPCDWPSSATR